MEFGKGQLAKHEIKTMSHHSKHHFITQYISLRGTAVTNDTNGSRRRGWVIRKRSPRSEAVTPIIDIYIGVGLNVVGPTR